jgi:hypothetical protein
VAPTGRRSRIAELIRAGRITLGLDQAAFGQLAFVSTRTVCRWEIDEGPPTPHQAGNILRALSGASPSIVSELAQIFGLAPAPLSPDVARVALDAVVHAAAEERDLLPRHLRAFGEALLTEVSRLGIDPRAAAALVAPRTPKAKR